MTRIIAFAGKIKSGKNYVVEQILIPYFKKLNKTVCILAFADFLKAICIAENNITYKNAFHEKNSVTRTLLQNTGDKYRKINSNYFISMVDTFINLSNERNSYDIIMITDLRFKTEYEYLLRMNATIFRVVAPERSLNAILESCKDQIDEESIKEKYNEITNHISEIDLDGVNNNITNIYNDYKDNCNILDIVRFLKI